MKKNFDFKKKMRSNQVKKFNHTKKVVTTTAIASMLVLSPISANINGQTLESLQNVLSPSYAAAAADEVASVDLLQGVTVTGSEVVRTEGGPSSFDLSLTSKELAEVDLLTPTLYTHFYAEEFAGNIVDGGSATVTLEILPITKENLPGLYDAVGGLTKSVTALTDEVGQLLDELLNISPGILQVNGLTEVTDALHALNNLEASLDSLTAYQTDVPVTVDHENGILTVEYGDGLGQHLEDAVNDVVAELLYDLANALENLEIVLLEGGVNTDNVLQLVRDLDNLPILGEVLSPLLGDGILG